MNRKAIVAGAIMKTSKKEIKSIKQQEQKERLQQLLLLKNYSGCQQCRSKEADAYDLFEQGQLVCQPCLMSKEGSSASPISFSEESKWYQKRWKINLNKWLETYGCLPVNKNCADKWLQNQEHLKNCDCLETEAKENHLLFSNSLKKIEKKLKECQCEESKKVRVSNDYYAWCEKCKTSISVASKKRVIKNRNDPRFWGLNIKEKPLCLKCLGEFQAKMPVSKKYTFNKYLKRRY